MSANETTLHPSYYVKKSKQLQVKDLQHELLAHTEQQVIKDSIMTSVKQFKQDNVLSI